MNYHEAAIFLEEGKNNEKFDSHPREPDALPAYLLVHNRWYYGLDLTTSMLLLALALVEDPAVPLFRLPVGVHGMIELIALAVIGAEVTLKLRWIGWGALLKHKRTMLKCITLAIMFVEAVTVLVRQSSHFRVTRALRPIFLVDTRHLGGVRRCIRQILQSMPPIFDMLALIFFFVSIYAILGYYLFSNMPNHSYFESLFDSFVSMFVLLTTANFPDVMMPAYAVSKWYSLFFISYLCICLYVLMNLMLAVVYETFTNIEREKFRKLLLHKRQACQHAFCLLTTKHNPTKMRFRQFEGLMRYFAPRKSIRDILLMFKQLNTSNSGAITLDEFCSVYDAVSIDWEVQYANIPWFHSAWMPLQRFCQLMHNVVMWTHFETIVCAIVVFNGMSMVYRGLDTYTDLESAARMFLASWDALFFLFLQSLEIIVKILGLGVNHYLHSGWNFYDLMVTAGNLVAVAVIYLVPSFTYGVVVRPLRLLHLFKMKKRYRDIIGTLALLTPLMCSTAVVMLVLYYFFAIIGMELFEGYDMKNCCKGTAVEDFYRYSANETSALGYYYLNTFENLATSYVTLFELTVVNNWFIMMTGYASVVHPLSRIYFILFYLTTMVVLTIVVASVLEAFRFRIQYKRHTTKRDEEKLLHEEIDLKWEEIQSWVQDFHILEKLRSDLVVGGIATFVGVRPRNREILQKRMYRSEIDQWMKEAPLAQESPHSSWDYGLTVTA
ncbi:two pore calcium channel protein 1-like isoform X2 [Macrosteles quadrilineatus]|nr:two pore calcium channel protein 1-like isoform X2 [Macrosteles quadrilineatus]XP_054279921.1 two pore calcium channel protein 1-like isoform X2 [Macrosteles quadrilineatus]